MTDHASPSRRRLFSVVGRAVVGAGGISLAGRVLGASGRLAADDGEVGAPASAAEPAERIGLTAPVAFPLAGFEAGDLVCLNNFGNCRRRHEGVDIGELRSLRPRVPLVACADGVITQRDDDPFDRPGRFVVIHGDDGRWYRYHHLDEIAEEVEVGARVSVGSSLGTMGSTGNTVWPHLHFEVWLGDGAFRGAGVALDPVPLLAIPPTVVVEQRECG